MHIQQHGPFYPDPRTCLTPEGFRVAYGMGRRGNGLCPERSAFVGLLTNAAYIGHWAVNGEIVRWNNHPSIIPVDIFMRAFNYLSPVTLDGKPNRSFRPFKQNARPSREQERPAERPLCAGMIVSDIEGQWRSVGTTWLKELHHYIYVLATPRPDGHRLWIKTVHFVDEAVTTLFREKFKATFDAPLWDERLARLNDKFEQEKKRIQSQLTALERVMQNQVASLDALTNSQMVSSVQTRYEAAQEEEKRLRMELATVEAEFKRVDSVYALKSMYGPALDAWDNITRDEKRVTLQAFINRIEAEEVEDRALKFIVRWRDGGSNEIILPRQAENGWREWLPSEVKRLLALVDAQASQVELAQAFPKRIWRMIKYKIESERGQCSFHVTPQPINENETYETYIVRVGDSQLAYQAGSGDHWTPTQEQQLLSLIDAGASRLEMAQAFPYRKWGRIRHKIHLLRG